MAEKKQVFTIQINYKSGISMLFDVTEFEINNGSYSWVAADPTKRPVWLNVDEVESVWQLGVK